MGVKFLLSSCLESTDKFVSPDIFNQSDYNNLFKKKTCNLSPAFTYLNIFAPPKYESHSSAIYISYSTPISHIYVQVGFCC